MLTIEYDSSCGFPLFYVWKDKHFVGYTDDTSLTFQGVFKFQEQLEILQELIEMIKIKPLTKENYSKHENETSLD